MADIPQEVKILIERLERDPRAYRAAGYNETQLRREFLDPFFTALGWDVENRVGYADPYKDVIHEDAIRIDGALKAPDYGFRIGGTRKFFLEAKRPSVNLQEDSIPAYQLRRYAWTAGLSLSVLSNFAEFAIYDTRIKPNVLDKASTARVFYCTGRQYAEKWPEIAAILSKSAVLTGAFDRFVISMGSKRGTTEVGQAFLEEIEAWRKDIAQNIALRNRTLTERELNTAVTVTIDRIIFLRICEDRGIERYGQLQQISKDSGVYIELLKLFRSADEKYNSGLFHFVAETGREELPDDLTPRLTIDDSTLQPILQDLYFPKSPYAFDMLKAEILGHIYEQFLGKIIRLTAGHRAKVEEKPEVRKAGGVFYTPTYIVDDIVQNTVGKMVDGKTPSQVAKLKILDPACGSGSFLLGAYQFLLDWHLCYFTENGPDQFLKQKSPPIYETTAYNPDQRSFRLTTAKKKEILLNNIFGVDIDSNAVETTKLSLLLKVLEGESRESVDNQMRMFRQRALPDLADNIKCGNSLVGQDFYNNQQLSLLNEQVRYKVNAFDWNTEFADIIRSGGFDAVIGNPPYLYSAGKEYQEYFESRYRLSEYQTDFYVFFIEKAFGLSRKGGFVSFIVSDSWLKAECFAKVRNYLLTQAAINVVAVFAYPVFGVALENSLFVAQADLEPRPFPIRKFLSPKESIVTIIADPHDMAMRNVIDPYFSPARQALIVKIEAAGRPLGSVARLNRGIHAYRTDGYGQTKFGKGHQTVRDKETESYHADRKIDETYIPELKGKDIQRFYHTPTGRFLSYGPWLAEPRTPDFFIKPKLAIRKILGQRVYGTFLEEHIALDQSLYIIIVDNNDCIYLKFLAGVLLSSLGAWWIRSKYAINDAIYPWYTKKQLASFPVPAADTRVSDLVDQMLVLHRESFSARIATDANIIGRKITATDRQIDRLVYELYKLTPGEIEIIENSVPQ